MEKRRVKVLLVQDNPDHVGRLRQLFSGDGIIDCQLEYAMTLRAGLERLEAGGIDIVLLELSLPDSRGLATFESIQSRFTHIPIVILGGLEDELIAVQAVSRGAQDYLLKNDLSERLVKRSILNAIERHRTFSRLLDLSLHDELTGLYNRRGFLHLARQQFKLASRNQNDFLVLVLDVDDLKAINDRYGHRQGDFALVRVATVLARSFRQSDIIARIGGDEFCALAVEAHPTSADLIRERLNSNRLRLNEEDSLNFDLSFSLGISHFNHNETKSIEALMDEADRAMYEAKRQKPVA